MQFTGREPITPSAPMLTVVGCAPPPPYAMYPTLIEGQKSRGQSEAKPTTLPGGTRADPSSSSCSDMPSDEEEENVVSRQPNGQTMLVNMSNNSNSRSNSGTPNPQTINYDVLYYAPTYTKTETSECINCCEDCCEDVCENCCLNCCLDCSRLTHTIFGGQGSGFANKEHVYRPMQSKF